MKQKVLVLTNNIGGLYSFRKEVIKSIIDSGYDVSISEPDNDERVRFFESIGCHIIKTQFNRRGMNPFLDLRLLLVYYRLIRSIKPAVVLTYTIKPNVYGGIACRLLGTRQLANVTGLGDAIENGGWLQKITVGLYRLGLSKSQCVFFQNSSNKEFFKKAGIAPNNTVLLPGSGVNLARHSYQAYPEDESIIKFLFIGRILKDKGIEELFEVARIIKTSYPNTEFQVLGECEGHYKEELDALSESGIINYLGTTTDIRPYLSRVHCTVMPSYHEGMSNVNLESAANGRPVITTNVPGCRETVEDGQSGFLIEAKNSEALLDAIIRFINLPIREKAEMGERGRKKVEREFDRRIIVNAYLKEISRLSD